jgi:hypothetical protein
MQDGHRSRSDAAHVALRCIGLPAVKAEIVRVE